MSKKVKELPCKMISQRSSLVDALACLLKLSSEEESKHYAGSHGSQHNACHIPSSLQPANAGGGRTHCGRKRTDKNKKLHHPHPISHVFLLTVQSTPLSHNAIKGQKIFLTINIVYCYCKFVNDLWR